MANFTRCICLPAILAVVPLVAQQGQVAGPVSGYVFDRGAHVLRPVLGIPGASILGDGVDFGMPPSAVYVAPRLDAAFVVANGSLHLFKLGSGSPAEVPLNGIGGVPEGIAFSPSGTAAALFAAGHVQMVKGLPAAPALAGVVDARANQQASAISVRPHPYRLMANELYAVSDDGTLLLVSSEGSVRLIQAAGSEQTLMDSAGAALVAFAPGGHDVAVASPTGPGLVVVRDAAGAATQQPIVAAADIVSANGVAFSTDGGKVYLALSSGEVAAFDVAAKTRTDITCDCVPFGLAPMGSLYRLNELGSGPLWLLDPAGNRIVFVPARTN